MPCVNSQRTKSGVWCPFRLSRTNSMRTGGRSTGKVCRTDRSVNHVSQAARIAAGGRSTAGGGKASRIAASCCLSHSCSTVFGQLVTPLTRTAPSLGWNKVRSLAVPLRTYSCGWRFGCPCSAQLWPGYGTVWNGPAWSVHQVAKPIPSPTRYACSISFFWRRYQDLSPQPYRTCACV